MKIQEVLVGTPQVLVLALNKQQQWKHLSHLHQVSKRYSLSQEEPSSTPQAEQHMIHWQLDEAARPLPIQKDTK